MLKNIKTKILFALFAINIFIVAIAYFNYYTQKKNYSEFIDYSIQSAINTIRSNILKTEKVVAQTMESRYGYFEKLHQEALEILKKDNNKELTELKNYIETKVGSEHLKVHLYLINSDYIIYKTTNDTDLGLDMKNFLGAKEYLDEALKEGGRVIVSKNLSFDVINRNYTVYSYAALDVDKKILFEIGFFDESASLIKNMLYEFSLNDSIIKEADLFANYGKYVVNVSKDDSPGNISKQEYLSKNINSEDGDIATVKNISIDKKPYGYKIKEGNKQYLIYYTSVLETKISNSKTKSYVLKTKLDVTMLEEKLADLETFLYATITLSVLFVLLFFLFLNSTFVKPFWHILESIKEWKRVNNADILGKNDELSELAKSFNYIYDKQVKLNNTLEERVSAAIKENERKEEILRKQLKLAQMGEMLSMIAHQWRQPLGSIGSAIMSLQLQLKSKKYDFEKKDELQKYLEFIEGKYQMIAEYVQFLSATIDDFRNFFKPNNQKEHISILVPIKKAMQILESSFAKNSIEIVTDFKVDEEIYIHHNELVQVIINILKNSMDNFIEKETKNPKIWVSTQKSEGYLEVSILDNGGGIPNNILENIFDPYFSTKNEKNGTGLGLYISKIMIEEHNKGLLLVKNQEDGASFTVRLKI